MHFMFFLIEGAAFLFGWWNFQLNEMCIKQPAKAIIIKRHNIFHKVYTGITTCIPVLVY